MSEAYPLNFLDHRPWPIPAGRWTWRQSWHDLLFAHWPIAKSQLRSLVPKELEIQEFDGVSWVGVVPFRMTGVMRRPLPDLPWVSAFPELNLRLYVNYENKPGVWFLSLDATNLLAVWAARRFFHLPYFRAHMSITPEGDGFAYKSARPSHDRDIRFEARYGPMGEPYRSKPGSLEHFLTERYCLYAQAPNGSLSRTEVHHKPWPLQPAYAKIATNDLLIPHQISVEGDPALLHFSRRVDVAVWSPRKVG